MCAVSCTVGGLGDSRNGYCGRAQVSSSVACFFSNRQGQARKHAQQGIATIVSFFPFCY